MFMNNFKQRKRNFFTLSIDIEIHVGELIQGLGQADHSPTVNTAQFTQLAPVHFTDFATRWIRAIDLGIMVQNNLTIGA